MTTTSTATGYTTPLIHRKRSTPVLRAGSVFFSRIAIKHPVCSCIGDHFATLEATLALATIIRRTEIRSLDADFPIIVPFTTVAAAPIRARVNDSSHAEGSAPLQI